MLCGGRPDIQPLSAVDAVANDEPPASPTPALSLRPLAGSRSSGLTAHDRDLKRVGAGGGAAAVFRAAAGNLQHGFEKRCGELRSDASKQAVGSVTGSRKGVHDRLGPAAEAAARRLRSDLHSAERQAGGALSRSARAGRRHAFTVSSIWARPHSCAGHSLAQGRPRRHSSVLPYSEKEA